MKLGVFLPNWIGDVAMATPTLRALRRHYGPQARIVGIMRPYVSEVLVGTNWIDDRLFFDPRSKKPELNGRGFAKKLRRERFDTVVLLTNSLRTGFWAWASGAKQRVGYARDVRSIFLTHKLYAPMAGGEYAPQSTLDAYLQIAYALGCPKESPRIELATTEADERAADDVWRRLAIPTDKPLVLLNSGAAFGASKLWPTEYFGQLARRIADEWGYPVLAMCGPREREIARQITTVADHPGVVSLADARLGDDYPLPLGLSKACVRRAALMVTTDSGPRHFAPAFDVPVITLFGPMPISLSETHFAKAVHLQHKVPCGPCLQQVCPLAHHQCMRDLSVDRVYQAVHAQLSELQGLSASARHGDSWTDGDRDGGGGPLVIPIHTWRSTTATHAAVAAHAVVAPATVGRPVIPAPAVSTFAPQAAELASAARPTAGTAQIWINSSYRAALADAELDDFTAVMATTEGRLMRALPDRENWWLRLHGPHGTTRGAFLKKHHVRSLAHWVRAKLGAIAPATPGRIEAENVARLAVAGIETMPVIAFGERLSSAGLLESFVMTEELTGYVQLDQFLRQRFPAVNDERASGEPRDPDLQRLLAQVADVAARFHRAGYNHRDLYCCHFFIREPQSGLFDVRLIDLQRVQHRTHLRRRWIVKDLAQLAYSAPREVVSRSRRLAFFKAYRGVNKLGAEDRRLLRMVLAKKRQMELKLGSHP
ncbi:MAG TPA: lipopolysaccharide heptosyltransferase II [Pirellulales bacterium]|nr:lipopolysaccharide heptosyltransferase II [Pirellulales bacterium]